MDTFLKENNEYSAALVAHEVMLQEFVDNPLTLAASLLSCLKCVKQIGSQDVVQEPEPESSEKVWKSWPVDYYSEYFCQYCIFDL